MARGYGNRPMFRRRRRVMRAIFYCIALDFLAGGLAYLGYKYGYAEGVKATEARVEARDEKMAEVYRNLGLCSWFVLAPQYYGCNRNAKNSRPRGNADVRRAGRAREAIRDNPAPR